MSTFKCHKDPQHPPLNPTNSCSVHPKSHRELHHSESLPASTSKSYGQPWHPPPNPTKGCSVHLQTKQGAAASTSKPHQEL